MKPLLKASAHPQRIAALVLMEMALLEADWETDVAAAAPPPRAMEGAPFVLMPLIRRALND